MHPNHNLKMWNDSHRDWWVTKIADSNDDTCPIPNPMSCFTWTAYEHDKNWSTPCVISNVPQATYERVLAINQSHSLWSLEESEGTISHKSWDCQLSLLGFGCRFLCKVNIYLFEFVRSKTIRWHKEESVLGSRITNQSVHLPMLIMDVIEGLWNQSLDKINLCQCQTKLHLSQ